MRLSTNHLIGWIILVHRDIDTRIAVLTILFLSKGSHCEECPINGVTKAWVNGRITIVSKRHKTILSDFKDVFVFFCLSLFTALWFIVFTLNRLLNTLFLWLFSRLWFFEHKERERVVIRWNELTFFVRHINLRHFHAKAEEATLANPFWLNSNGATAWFDYLLYHG